MEAPAVPGDNGEDYFNGEDLARPSWRLFLIHRFYKLLGWPNLLATTHPGVSPALRSMARYRYLAAAIRNQASFTGQELHAQAAKAGIEWLSATRNGVN